MVPENSHPDENDILGGSLGVNPLGIIAYNEKLKIRNLEKIYGVLDGDSLNILARAEAIQYGKNPPANYDLRGRELLREGMRGMGREHLKSLES